MFECSQTDNGVEFTNKFVSNADNLAPHAFDLNDLLDEHSKFRNSQRRRKPLNWQTPNQVLEQKGILAKEI